MEPITLEEVFNHVSVVVASNLNPAPNRTVLTPRSAEVCLKMGINPEVLKIRDIDSFWEAGLEPAVQRMRHEAYVQRRYEIMKQCRLERKRLMNTEFEQATAIVPTTSMTPEMLLQQQQEAGSTLIALEMARIKKMQQRQEKELEQMISYEVTRAKVAEEMEMRMQEAKKKDELRKKQQEKRLKLGAEERRLRELQKAALEEVEEENRRALAHEMHKKEVELVAAAAERAAEEKRQRRAAEVERKAKLEEQRATVQKYFADEQMALRRKLETLHLAEEKKQAAMLKRQAEQSEILTKRRAMIEKRINENMKLAKMVEEKRKNDFLEKTDHHERLREEALRRQEMERNLHAQEIQLQEQRRRMILLQKRKEEEKKAEDMLVKFDEDEVHVMEVQAIREKEHEILREKKNIRTQMKLENVERVHRVGEYKRMGTLKKIEDVDGRVKNMLQMRRSLIDDRRRAAAQTKRQKEAIAAVMEEVRTNASKAAKLIGKAMTGNISLASLTGGDKIAKKTSKKAKSTAELLGLERESQSAGQAIERPAGMEERLYSQNPDAVAPKPYISPFDS